jgi:transposase InsO family protein
MSWMEASAMSLRHEFVMLAMQPDANVQSLCRRFGISRKTAYKWISRFEKSGGKDPAALADQSRRPAKSPGKTQDAVEQSVCDLRRRRPAWGGRKIKARLEALGHSDIPAISTVTDILRRHGLLNPAQSVKHTALVRFEHLQPNDLWQMDFLGHFATDSGRCHPLTVLDDHSRFCLGVRACPDQTGKTVQNHLKDLFRRYGLPARILCDNGSPWGCDGEHRYTWLSAWFVRLGIGVSHGRPHHPQTQGKDERFNRTVRAEAIGTRRFRHVQDAQAHFDPWRDIYNLERPHQALNMATPASRYQASPRVFPEVLPPIEYGPDDAVRKVDPNGYFQYKNRKCKISQAFNEQPVALRPNGHDGQMDVFFCHAKIATIDLKSDTRIH